MPRSGSISAGVIGPLRPRDIIIVVKRDRASRLEGVGRGERGVTLVIDPTTPGIDAASGFDRNSKLGI